MPKSPQRRTSMTMCFGIGSLSERCGSESPWVQRKPVCQSLNLAADVGADLLALDVLQNARDESGDLANFRFAEPSRGDRGAPEAHSAGVEGRILIERYGIAVGGDVRGLERGMSFFAASALGEYVDQQHMRIGAAGDDAIAGIGKARG